MGEKGKFLELEGAAQVWENVCFIFILFFRSLRNRSSVYTPFTIFFELLAYVRCHGAIIISPKGWSDRVECAALSLISPEPSHYLFNV